jgi:hypothetical protein
LICKFDVAFPKEGISNSSGLKSNSTSSVFSGN